MANIKDVAAAANVAPMTVSRVINTPDLVRPATRSAVYEAMERLHYSPNAAAKNLVTKRTGIVDVYIPETIDLSNPFAMHLIVGISKVLSAHMYSFLILRNRSVEHACDGYIVTGLLHDEVTDFARYASGRKRPLVLFGHTGLPDVDCIDVDNVRGAYMAADALLRAGHRKIAMINVDEDKDYTEDRRCGYAEALRDHGIPYDGSRVVRAANNVAGGADAVRRLLRQDRPSAIFCATDTLAIGAAGGLAELSLRVPEDISLVGFDGLGHHLLASPCISTVRQPVCEIGSMLAEALLGRLDGRTEKIERLVEPEFLKEASVRPVR